MSPVEATWNAVPAGEWPCPVNPVLREQPNLQGELESGCGTLVWDCYLQECAVLQNT